MMEARDMAAHISQMGSKTALDENAVRVIVQDAFDSYEETTGKPRHEQNLDNFTKLFGALSWVKGAACAFGTLLTAIELYFKLHGR
jgi:hypothetical protein